MNEPKPDAPDKKLGKVDIAKVRAVCIDLDPDKKVLKEEGGFERERERLAERMFELREDPRFPPTFTVDSGGGHQAFWRLSESVPVGEDFAQAEAQGYGFVRHFGGDSVHNLDRIMRLPGPLNVLDAGKRKLGRKPAQARLVYDSGKTYRLEDLAAWIPPVTPPPQQSKDDGSVNIDWAAVDIGADYSKLPEALRSKFEAAKARDERLAQLWDDDESVVPGDDQSPSQLVWWLAIYLHRTCEFTATEFAQLLWTWDRRTTPEKLTKRYIARTWSRTSDADPRAAFGFDTEKPAGAGGGRRRSRGWYDGEAGAGASDDTDEPRTLWPEEDEPPALPRGVVPEIVERFAADQEIGLGVERGAPALSLITALAALIPAGNALQMRQVRDDWREPPITWAMIAADSGSAKTPMFSARDGTCDGSRRPAAARLCRGEASLRPEIPAGRQKEEEEGD